MADSEVSPWVPQSLKNLTGRQDSVILLGLPNCILRKSLFSVSKHGIFRLAMTSRFSKCPIELPEKPASVVGLLSISRGLFATREIAGSVGQIELGFLGPDDSDGPGESRLNKR